MRVSQRLRYWPQAVRQGTLSMPHDLFMATGFEVLAGSAAVAFTSGGHAAAQQATIALGMVFDLDSRRARVLRVS